MTMGATVYVVDMPVVEEDYVGLHPRGIADHEQYEAAFAQLALDDRLFVVSARDVAPRKAFFADPLHLNGKGANRLARWLANTILAP
jgi:lysophospholipase L1-like esterase